MRLSNIARSLSEIVPQASLFVPMTLPTARLPTYVTVDRQSQWHVSGLLSTAFESVSLLSRLKTKNGNRQTMDSLVNALNINGNQNIAKLRMSVDQTTALNGHHIPGKLTAPPASRDSRVPSQARSFRGSQTSENSDLTAFDMEFFPEETGEQIGGRQSNKEPHVFGQVEGYRVKEIIESQETSGEDGGYERKRQRAAGLPLIQKLVRIFNSCSGNYLVLSYREQAIRPFQVSLHAWSLAAQIPANSTAEPSHPCCFPCLTAFPTSFHRQVALHHWPSVHRCQLIRAWPCG
jgi:Tubulin domain